MVFLKKINGNMIYSSDVPKRWSYQKNCTEIWSFLYHEERWHFFFPKIWYLFYGRKTKDDISRMKDDINAWKYDVFCMLVKMVFLFPRNMKLPFCQKKAKMIFSRKMHLKITFPTLLKKMIFIPEKVILAFSGLLWRPF